jgi:hypothetical protein
MGRVGFWSEEIGEGGEEESMFIWKKTYIPSLKRCKLVVYSNAKETTMLHMSYAPINSTARNIYYICPSYVLPHSCSPYFHLNSSDLFFFGISYYHYII